MTLESHDQWPCHYCMACFPTRDSLQSHWAEYRSRAAELEQCRAHANAADLESEGDGNKPWNNVIKRNTSCPYEGCSRRDPFLKGQQLRVHFRQHVACDTPEVCVYCFQVFRYASEYIRHAREHNSADQTKTEYTSKIIERLRTRSDEQLMKLLQSAPKTMGTSKHWKDIAVIPDLADARSHDRSVHGTPSGDNLANPKKRKHLDVHEQSAQSDQVPPSERGAESLQLDGQCSEHEYPTVTSQPLAKENRCEKMSLSMFPSSDTGTMPTSAYWKNHHLEQQPSTIPFDRNRDTSAIQPVSKFPPLRTDLNSTSHGARMSEERSTTLTADPRQESVQEATMRFKILEYMLLKRPVQNEHIQRYVQELTPQRLRDLYTTIFDPIGLHHDELKYAFTDLRSCLETAEAYAMERELQIPRSTCMSVDIDAQKGDHEVRIKVGRDEGLRFIKKYRLLMHIHFDLPVRDL